MTSPPSQVTEEFEELHEITLEQPNMTSSFSEEQAEDLAAAVPGVNSADPILEVDEHLIGAADEDAIEDQTKWEHPTFSSPEAERRVSPLPAKVRTPQWEHPTFSSPELDKECLSPPTLEPSQEEIAETLSPVQLAIDLDISDGVIELNESENKSEEGKIMNTESLLVDNEKEDVIEAEDEVKDISGIVAELEEEFASHHIEDISIHDETEIKVAMDLEDDKMLVNDDTVMECDTDEIQLNFRTEKNADTTPETDETLKLPVITNDVTTQKWEHPTFSSPQKEYKLSEHPTFSSPPPVEKVLEPVMIQLLKHSIPDTKRIVFPPNFTVSKACPVGLNQRILLDIKNTTNLWVQCNIR